MRALALVGLALAALTAAGPRFLVPVCGSRPGVDPVDAARMHCYQAGQVVELAMACAALLWLLVALQGRARGALIGGAAVAAGVALGAVLVYPGVCGAPTMSCVVGTRPVVVVLGALQLGVAAGALLARWRGRRAQPPR